MNNPFLSILRDQLSSHGVDPRKPAWKSFSVTIPQAPKPKEESPKPTIIEAKGPPISMFYCLKDKYYSHDENSIAPPEEWWTNARFRPKELSDILGMSFDEALIWRSINAGRHVCISGKAGAGKSFLIRNFIQSCSTGSFCYGVSGPTAISAYNISGETLHKKLSLGLAEEPAITLWQKISKSKNKFAKTWKFLMETQVLIIDEISMVHPEFYQKFDFLFRQARGIDAPFGGCIIVMLGDFTQLGPVMKTEVNLLNVNVKPELVIDTDTWKKMKIARLCLVRSYRQKNGPFLDLLDHVRMGNMTKNDFDLIKSRIGKKVDIKVETKDNNDEKKKQIYRLEPIDIFPHCRSVDKRNSTKLNELLESGEKLFSFRPYLKVQKKDAYNIMVLDHKDRAEGERLIKNQDSVKKKFPIYHLNVCKGSQVMMRSNSLMEIGVFNGTMGIVTNVTNQEISVVFVVNGEFMKKPIKLERAMFSCPVGKTGEVVMTQFPLSLAYSCTIHKCQGLTMDCIRLDARHCWEPGQLYTALSRVRKLEDLYLFGFNARSLLINPKAVEFEDVKLPDEFRKLEGMPTIAEEESQKKEEYMVTGKRYRDDHILEKKHDMDHGEDGEDYYRPKKRSKMTVTLEVDESSGPTLSLADLGNNMFDPFAVEPSEKESSRDFSIDTSQL